MKNGKFRKQE
jgi:signal transduction histidine kinase